MLIKLPTEKTVNAAADAIQAAVKRNHFGVMQVHNLQETMVKKGVEFAHERFDCAANSHLALQGMGQERYRKLCQYTAEEDADCS